MAVNASGGERGNGEEARIARLYRLASAEEPPPHVDAVIAAAARRPVQAVLHRRPAPWWSMWRLPFALAAVAVISVSLVTLMMEEGGERLTSVPPAAPPAVVERDRHVSEGPTAKDESQAPERRGRGSEPSAPGTDAVAADPEADAARAGSLRREAAPARETQRRAAEPGASALLKAAPEQAVQSKAVGPATLAQDRASAPAVAAPPRLEAQTAGPEGRPAPAPAARAAPQAFSGARALESERRVASAPHLSPEVAAHVAQLEGHAPSVWIERIVALRRDGRRAEADGLLAEFRRRFPEEALPPSLQ